MKRGLLGLLCVVVLVSVCLQTVALPVTAAAQATDVRVGLAALYAAQPELKITTTKLGFGYCMQESYRNELTISSESGFVFRPATGYFYCSEQSFTSFAAAQQAAARVVAVGMECCPALIGRGTWKVYAGGGAEKSGMQSAFRLIRDVEGLTFSALSADNGHRVQVSGKAVSFLYDGAAGAYPQCKAMTDNTAGDSVISLGSRSYRGRIEIGRYGAKTLTAVNIINVEVYLYSVIASEMNSSWPMEALKAQAVCARSYALTKTGYTADSSIRKAYYLEDTVNTQVYKGYGQETARSREAARATAGETVRYQGKTITAFFYSTSGGHTESGIDVWGLSQSYYTALPDPYETEPERAPWIVSMTGREIADRLTAKGFSVGTVRSVTAQIRTTSNRIYSMKINGSKGNAMLQVGAIRDVLGLPSTKLQIVTAGEKPDLATVRSSGESTQARIGDCYVLSADSAGRAQKLSQTLEQFIVRSADNLTNFVREAPKEADTYLFAGMGYGHGVGMSQSGARGMADAGFSYREILAYYFPGTEVG